MSERSKHPQQQTALDALVLLNRLPAYGTSAVRR